MQSARAPRKRAQRKWSLKIRPPSYPIQVYEQWYGRLSCDIHVTFSALLHGNGFTLYTDFTQAQAISRDSSMGDMFGLILKLIL